MADRQWFVPGVGVIHEEGTKEYMLPGGGVIAEDQAVAVGLGPAEIITMLNRDKISPLRQM